MDICVENGALSGKIQAISSKSDVHRFLIAAALANGVSTIRFTTLSEDIKATIAVLRALGAKIEIADGFVATVYGIENANRDITLDANECGTTARLMLPIAAALTDVFTLTGKNGLLKRPFFDLCKCMGENGATCDKDTLPISVQGKLKSGIYKIRGDVSSQYISGLLFALPLLDGTSEIHLTTPLVSSGYVDMTVKTLSLFGINVEKSENGFKIKGNQHYTAVENYVAEGDWSNSCFWLLAGLFGDVTVLGLDKNSLQKDRLVLEILHKMGADISYDKGIRVKKSSLSATSFNGEDIPDALPMLASALSLADGKSVISGGARLKIKESDRIKSTADMLNSIGGKVSGTDDGFIINGVKNFSGGKVNAENDHRIVMCAAVAASAATSPITIVGAEAVNKSYPTFFEDFEKLGGKHTCQVNSGAK